MTDDWICDLAEAQKDRLVRHCRYELLGIRYEEQFGRELWLACWMEAIETKLRVSKAMFNMLHMTRLMERL